MTVVVVLISRLKSGECGSMCPLKHEHARRETQQWVMRRLPTRLCIGRKSRSWIEWECDNIHNHPSRNRCCQIQLRRKNLTEFRSWKAALVVFLLNDRCVATACVLSLQSDASRSMSVACTATCIGCSRLQGWWVTRPPCYEMDGWYTRTPKWAALQYRPI